MDFSESGDEARLRQRLRDLTAAEVPPGFMGAFTHDPADLAVAQSFCRRLAEEGLLTAAWPVEHGGQGASLREQTILREEMWAHHEPRGAQYMNVNWIGPTIMRFGTKEQQEQHLPPMAAGHVIWCQGFSEPDSGSDLASLRTAAVRDGDKWRIHGQKIWTSYATMADWCFLLARTNPDAPKHHGISVFLLPMDQAGVQVRPIRTFLGGHHLNEVFFDGAVVGPAGLLGTVDGGWSIVREVLALERLGIARYARCDRLLYTARHAIGEAWGDLPAALRQRWAAALVHTRVSRLLAYRVVEAQQAGNLDPKDVAAYRISVTTLDQEVADVLVEMVQASGVSGPLARAVDDHWRYAQASTVASGTVEVQRILLSRALVGAAR